MVNVLYVLGMKQNLFSVAAATQREGIDIVFEGDACRIIVQGMVFMNQQRNNGVYRFRVHQSEQANAAKEDDAVQDAFHLHRRCGHNNMATLRKMSTAGIIQGFATNSTMVDNCTICVKGKMTRINS